MIRGNYSLAQEVRKNELKQRQKIQQRQKHQHRLEKLSSCDPIKLYFHIQRLEGLGDLDSGQQKKLHGLRQDWAFIIKNKLFKEKVDAFLKEQDDAKKAKLKAERKLWGRESVYFNAELNPLGKPPTASSVTIDPSTTFPNLKKSPKHNVPVTPDPLIEQLGIQPPHGDPPRFYKSVQNTSSRPKESESVLPQKRSTGQVDYRDLNLDTDSDHETFSDD